MSLGTDPSNPGGLHVMGGNDIGHLHVSAGRTLDGCNDTSSWLTKGEDNMADPQTLAKLDTLAAIETLILNGDATHGGLKQMIQIMQQQVNQNNQIIGALTALVNKS